MKHSPRSLFVIILVALFRRHGPCHVQLPEPLKFHNRDQGPCSLCARVLRLFWSSARICTHPRTCIFTDPTATNKKIWLAVRIVNCGHFSQKLSQVMETTRHLVSFMCMLILEKTICCSNTAHNMTQVIETKQDFHLSQSAPINWNLKNELSISFS